MRVREAAYADLLPASKLLADAFRDESFLGQYVHPYRDKYPEDMYLFFLNWLRPAYAKGGDDRIIVTTKTDDNGNEIVTGVAHWQRKRAKKPPLGLYELVKVKAMESYIYMESLVYPNRAADPSKTAILAQMDPFTKHHWTGTRADSWYLSLIGVDPKFHGQGAGRLLVEWGFQRARKDNVGCSVISAEGKAPFYRKLGYDIDCGSVSDEGGEKNPIGHLPGGMIHFWDNNIEPKGIKKYGEA